MQIKIKKSIVEKLQKRVDSSDEFDSVEEYVDYILQQVVERLEQEQGQSETGDGNDDNKEEEEAYSKEDEEKVKERLRGLGYLD